MQRCNWVGADPLMIKYHDTEWGVPVNDDTKLFEFLILDSMQAGLSWRTILNKRAAFNAAFDNFDITKVAKYNDNNLEMLIGNSGIIRNRQKLEAAVNNAQRIQEVQKEFGSFSKYIWGFVGGKTIKNKWQTDSDIPSVSPEAETMSKDMKSWGFKFVGPTICYAFMQGAGLVNDHEVSCSRYEQV